MNPYKDNICETDTSQAANSGTIVFNVDETTVSDMATRAPGWNLRPDLSFCSLEMGSFRARALKNEPAGLVSSWFYPWVLRLVIYPF